ncbi:MAG: methyltransferase domain-containing protein [Bryobacterales bacterium]|nr:methyltransferase domain-containing protein [Bryobacterales bacterium]
MSEQKRSETISEKYTSNGAYFSWYAPLGEFGGWANLSKFTEFIKPDYNVLDFGCGGGYLLEQIQCKERRGIEVSPTARDEAQRRNIGVVANQEEIPDGWADLIISNSVLEHCLRPLDELKALLPKLKKGGRAVFVVPCEPIFYKHKLNDINHHLYCWSPMALGNLFTEAGFKVEESKCFVHVWPPRGAQLLAKGGRKLFDVSCRIFGWLIYMGIIRRPGNQVRVVSVRED